MIFFSS